MSLMTIKEGVLTRVQETLGTSATWIDSHSLAKRLKAPLTYVQHVLREAPQVCRYADDLGRYRIHEADECGPHCQEHDTRPQQRPVTPVCPSCNLHQAANGACGCF